MHAIGENACIVIKKKFIQKNKTYHTPKYEEPVLCRLQGLYRWYFYDSTWLIKNKVDGFCNDKPQSYGKEEDEIRKGKEGMVKRVWD